ncbi:MAG TPA: hypothetical protein DE179_14540 [Oceanospirillaceae bacterium]|nr:hypothetical protein [Oceanospirillaceae bacterium]
MSLLSAYQNQRLIQSDPNYQISQLDCRLQVSQRRRSIGFKVGAGVITLQVPYGLPEKHLAKAVASKRAWLLAKQAQQLAMSPVPKRQLVAGECWPVLGEPLSLQFVTDKQHSIRIVAGQLIVALTSRQQSLASKQRLIEAWYKAQAQVFAQQRVDYWQQVMNIEQPAVSIKVRYFRSRWGSCSSQGELKFNWLLAMAPEFVFDYVVVHEVCHIRHLHHGQEFWHMVARYCPEYQQAKQWLRAHGYSLVMNPAA